MSVPRTLVLEHLRTREYVKKASACACSGRSGISGRQISAQPIDTKLSRYEEDVEAIEPLLGGMPDAPTVLITVERGVARFHWLPKGEAQTVNVVLIDFDGQALSDEVDVQRFDAGEIEEE
jgi:hypothetical protein